MTDRKPTPGAATADASPGAAEQTAAQIAGGSSIVFAGGLFDRGIRFAIKWFLSGALGPELVGVFYWAVTWASTLASFAPLGLDTGVVLFAARYRKSGELDRAKAALLFGLFVSLAMGAIGAAALWWTAPWLAAGTERVRGLVWAAALLLPWTPLLYLVGTLRAVKDMKRSALASQIILPGVFLVGAVALVHTGWSLDGAFAALLAATGLGALAAARFAWRHYGDLLRDARTRPAWEPGTLLAFSIPQGLTAAAFRLNSYMDVLMLGYLASMAEVGTYTVAAGLAAFGTLPSNAVASMFNPFIAELVYVGETERLDMLLKTVTRWLIVVSAPVYLVLLVLPDVVLGLFAPVYAVALVPLLWLVGGQAIQTACAPTMRLIPMSGHATLNLVNGLVALALNVALNAWWIPSYGAVGAAMATGVTLAAWSLWRVVEVKWLLGCFPFDRRSGVLLAMTTATGLSAAWLGEGQHLLLRIGLLGLAVLVLVGTVALVCRTDADRALVSRVGRRMQRLVGSGRR